MFSKDPKLPVYSMHVVYIVSSCSLQVLVLWKVQVCGKIDCEIFRFIKSGKQREIFCGKRLILIVQVYSEEGEREGREKGVKVLLFNIESTS